MKVFSLASITGTLTNDNYGNANFGGEKYISLGGGGKLIDTIKYSFKNLMFDMGSTADGGAYVAHNASKQATITFSISQTSPHISILSEYFKWCWANPDLAEADLTVRDSTGNLAFEAHGVFPKQFPDNSVSDSQSTRDFTFVAAELIPQESNIG